MGDGKHNSSKKGAADRQAIQHATLDYVEGWYEGDGERMARCLHPSLVKRALKETGPGGKTYLNYLTREEMVAAAEAGGGSHVPASQRSYAIKILDIYEEMASVRADSPDWIDYLQLVKINGHWLIANVLYSARRA